MKFSLLTKEEVIMKVVKVYLNPKIVLPHPGRNMSSGDKTTLPQTFLFKKNNITFLTLYARII